MYLGHFVRVVRLVSAEIPVRFSFIGRVNFSCTGWISILNGWPAGRLQPSILVCTFLFRGNLFFQRLFCVNLLGRLRFLFLIKHERSERSCCLCGFVFVDKKRKRSIIGEFAEIFANVCKEKNKDGLPRAVCGTCKYRVEKAWKNYSH